MPKDNIERAIAKGTGADQDADAFEPIVYEGYGPGGVALLVEALTDNRNRTGSEVRHAFSESGGNLGEPGSVAWQFEKKGELVVDAARYSEDDLMAAIDAGAEDVALDEDVFEVVTAPDRLHRGARGARGSGGGAPVRRAGDAPDHPHEDRRGGRGQADAADRHARGARRRAGSPRELRRGRRSARARSGGALEGIRPAPQNHPDGGRPRHRSRHRQYRLRRGPHARQHARGARRRRDRHRPRRAARAAPGPDPRRRLRPDRRAPPGRRGRSRSSTSAQNARTRLRGRPGPRRRAAGRRAGRPPCFSYTPQQIKQAVCGSGRAAKDQVQRMVGALLEPARRHPSPTTRPTPWRWPSATPTRRPFRCEAAPA